MTRLLPRSSAEGGPAARLMLPILFGLLLVPPATMAAEDDWTPGTYMTQAMGRVMGTVRLIDDQSDFGYDGPGTICFMGGFFRPGDSIGFDRELERGTQYAFVGGGDDDVVDVDIEIFNEDGALVAEDTKDDAEPMVQYTPPRSGTYTINVTLYKAPEASFCALAILKRDGVDVPTENVVRATGGLLGHCTTVAEKVNSAGFNTEPNQWAVWGAVYEPGQRLTINNVKLPKGVNVFIAAGDTQTVDVDVHLLTDADALLIEDVLEDAEPRVVFEAKGDDSTYQVATTNASSNGVTLIMTAALKAE